MGGFAMGSKEHLESHLRGPYPQPSDSQEVSIPWYACTVVKTMVT